MTLKAFPKDSDGRFMDLRDYFAGIALQSFLGASCWNLTIEESVAKAYQTADQMIKEREK